MFVDFVGSVLCVSNVGANAILFRFQKCFAWPLAIHAAMVGIIQQLFLISIHHGASRLVVIYYVGL